MKTEKELNDLKKEVETLNEKLSELTDEELFDVTGGLMTEQEKIQLVKSKINMFYSFIPEQMRNLVLTTYEKLGKDAAVSLAQKLFKNNPTWLGIINLLI